MLDLVPTPYFGFRGDRQLDLRFFRLPGFQQDAAHEGAALDAVEFVVLGRGAGSRTLADSVRTRGERMAQVPGDWPSGTLARLYRMRPRGPARMAQEPHVP